MLRLLVTELNGPEIAMELGVSLATVRTHTQHIYGKLGVTNGGKENEASREENARGAE